MPSGHRTTACAQRTGAAASVEGNVSPPERSRWSDSRAANHCFDMHVSIWRKHTMLAIQTKSTTGSRRWVRIETTTYRYEEQNCKDYRRVPKYSPYGSVCCACARRPGLLAHANVTKNIKYFSMGPKLRYPTVQDMGLMRLRMRVHYDTSFAYACSL